MESFSCWPLNLLVLAALNTLSVHTKLHLVGVIWLAAALVLHGSSGMRLAVSTLIWLWHSLPFHHLTLSAQYAADIFPLEIFFACRALKLA